MYCPRKENAKKASEIFESLSKWDDGVENVASKIKGKWEEFQAAAVDKAQFYDKDGKSVNMARRFLGFRKFASICDEIEQNINEMNSRVLYRAQKTREKLATLKESEREPLFDAARGKRSVESLPLALQGVAREFKSVFERGANRLIELGALNKNAKIEDYVHYMYNEAATDAINGGRLTQARLYKRKDLSDEQRKAIGLITDPQIVFPATQALQERQIGKFEMLKTIAEKWTKQSDFKGAVQVPLDTAANGVYKWGAMAGRYMDAGLFEELSRVNLVANELNELGALWQAVSKLTDHIKVNMTVKNPFTHLYNFGSNGVLATLHGDLGELSRTLKDCAARNGEWEKLVALARENGLNSALDDLGARQPQFLQYLQNIAGAGSENNALKILNRVWKEVYMAEGSKLGNFMREAYAFEDEIFKLARFRKNLEKGMSEREAMREASAAYVNYSTHLNSTVRFLDRTGVVPFLHFTVKSTPLIIKTAAKHPVKFVALQAALMGAGGSSWLNDNDDNDLKPEWAQSHWYSNFMGVKNFGRLGNSFDFLNYGRAAFGGRTNDLEEITSLGFWGSFGNILQGRTAQGFKKEPGDASGLEKLSGRALEMAKNFLPAYVARYGAPLLGNLLGIDTKNAQGVEEDALDILKRAIGVRELRMDKELTRKVRSLKTKMKDLGAAGDKEGAEQVAKQIARLASTAVKYGVDKQAKEWLSKLEKQKAVEAKKGDLKAVRKLQYQINESKSALKIIAGDMGAKKSESKSARVNIKPNLKPKIGF